MATAIITVRVNRHAMFTMGVAGHDFRRVGKKDDRVLHAAGIGFLVAKHSVRLRAALTKDILAHLRYFHEGVDAEGANGEFSLAVFVREDSAGGKVGEDRAVKKLLWHNMSCLRVLRYSVLLYLYYSDFTTKKQNKYHY
jgi:hypothetical protein